MTVGNIPSGTWTEFDVSSITAFANVDEFRFQQTAGGTATVSFVALDEITIATATALPLTLVDFSGSRNGDAVQLNWKTMQESNTRDFSIQRSVDGASFTTVGEVAAAGNSSTLLTYDYIDAIGELSQHALYYRLRMNDLDDRFTYSPILYFGDIAGGNLSAYPNPFVSQLTVAVHSDVVGKGVLTLNDMNGRKAMSQQVNLRQGSNSVIFPGLGGLSKGVYMLVVRMEGRPAQTIPVLKAGD